MRSHMYMYYIYSVVIVVVAVVDESHSCSKNKVLAVQVHSIGSLMAV